jgi:hypothetical protein
VKSRNIIEYDDIQQILYVVDYKGKLQIEIPIENIDKILYSNLGLNFETNFTHSYIIVYSDQNGEKKKILLFPISFQNDVKALIIDTKIKNPNLITSNKWFI